jgi:N-acetylglutamate synthase-like GNAT family acetyltransferase
MITIRQAAADDVSDIREIFWEYLQWANNRINQEFNFNFDITTMLQHDMDEVNKFMPPNGRLLIAVDDTMVVGCACMHTINPTIAELKRMYVRPDQRRKGLGRVLIQALISDIREAGYTKIRLDSARFMKEAHVLYRSLGFQEIDPYPESEAPEAFRKHWIFMEYAL